MQSAFAAVLTGPRTFEHREFPLPEIGDDDGLLRVEANGLCGTDYDQYLCELNLGPFGKPPIIPGHEMIGWIEKVGPRAARAGMCARAIVSASRRRCHAGAADLPDGGVPTLRTPHGVRTVSADDPSRRAYGAATPLTCTCIPTVR